MPINRIARVTSQSANNYPAVRSQSVPFVYDEQYGEFAFTDENGNARHIPWLQSGIHTENLVRYEYGTLTSAQVKALRATPATLVAAPAAGKILEFISLQLFLDYGSNGFTETADNLVVRYLDGTGVIVSQAIEMTGFIDQTADTMTNALPKIDAIAAKTACDGKALVLHNTGDGEIAGNAANDSVVRYKVVYRVHPAGW